MIEVDRAQLARSEIWRPGLPVAGPLGVSHRSGHQAIRGRIRGGWQRISEKLWFVPGIAGVVAFALARVLVYVDETLIERGQVWFAFSGTPDGARELVSTVASATMTFTGLVFSITVLVLQLASQQFSPRVLRVFLQDRTTKFAMAMFVGTFIFAMSLLLSIRGSTDMFDERVPALSVFIAFLLVIGSVGVFIQYLHHIAHSIRVVTIVRRIADETREAIDRTFPMEGRDEPEHELEPPPGPAGVCWFHGRAGSLTMIDEDWLLELAEEHDAVIEILPVVGDFVMSRMPVIRYWPADRDELACAVQALVTEAERRCQHDPLFGFRELVDIAERALSPSLNDPSTAVQVLDELHELLRHLSTRSFPSPVRRDKAGVVRLVVPRPTWEAFVHLAVDEIRQFGRGSSQVVERLRVLVEDCSRFVPPERRGPLDDERAKLQGILADRERTPPFDRARPTPAAVTH